MKRHLPLLLLIVAVITVQLATKLTGTAFYLTQLTMTAYYSLLIAGLCLVMGYAGQISLGHAGFFAIGGYTSAALTGRDLTPFQDNALLKLAKALGLLNQATGLMGENLIHLSPWAACVIALLVTVVVAYAIGVPVLKLKGHYLAMATLGFGIIVYRLVLASKLLGEADGISEVPGFPLLPGLTVSGDFSARVTNYYIAWSMVVLAMWLIGNLIHSRVGRALRAIHGAEEATNAMGVDTARYKLNTFVISAVLAALAGIFLTHYNGGIGPSEAGVMKSVRYVAIVAIGGMANLWGALTMGVLLNFLSLRGMFGTYDDAVFGVILIVIMLFAPHGLLRLTVFASLKKLLRRGAP